VQAGQYGGANNAGRMRQAPQPVVLVKGPAFGREHTDDRALDAVQQRTNDSTQAAMANPLSQSNFIQNLTFVSGTPLIIKHGLDRAFVSAVVCAQSVAGNFSYQRPSTITRPPSVQNQLDTRQIVITYHTGGQGSTCMADLLVW
jgi:hypothetical protein